MQETQPVDVMALACVVLRGGRSERGFWIWTEDDDETPVRVGSAPHSDWPVVAAGVPPNAFELRRSAVGLSLRPCHASVRVDGLPREPGRWLPLPDGAHIIVGLASFAVGTDPQALEAHPAELVSDPFVAPSAAYRTDCEEEDFIDVRSEPSAGDDGAASPSDSETSAPPERPRPHGDEDGVCAVLQQPTTAVPTLRPLRWVATLAALAGAYLGWVQLLDHL